MVDWQERFKSEASALAQKGFSACFSYRGLIYWRPNETCSNCGNLGIFYGNEIDCGKLFQTASAQYCPSCSTVNVIRTDIISDLLRPHRFLRVMKERLIVYPELRQDVMESGACPSCGKKTCHFQKDIGIAEVEMHCWTVCINLECDWPGIHLEIPERGLSVG